MDLNSLIRLIAAFLSLMMTLLNFLLSSFGSGAIEVPTVTVTDPGTSVTYQIDEPSVPGTFTITAYGWGHGVGMSQQGAIVMANNGEKYVKILEHYFTGAHVYAETSTPSTITYGSKSYPILEFLCKTVKAEIGADSPKEAIKAQAAAIYSFAKYYDYKVTSSQMAMSSSYASGSNMEKYVMVYLGMSSTSDAPKAKFVTTDGRKACLAIFGDCVAGHTCSAESVWGQAYSYLVPVTSPETVTSKSVSITAEDMRNCIRNYKSSITLSADPSQWLKITAHDSALNSTVGYVSSMKIGNDTISGWNFRYKVVGINTIRSHCMTIKYNA